VAYDSTDNKLYLPFQEVGYESLAVIDGYSHAVVKKLDLPDANLAVWDTVSGRLYISRCYSNCVSVLDCRADTFVAHIAVGAAPLKMYINTLRRKLYVLNYDAGTVSVIDLATNQVIKTIDVGTVPNAGYYCRRMDKFYCPGEYGEVVAIDGRTDSIVARIPIRQNSLILSLAGNDAIPVVMVGVYDGGSYVYTVNAALDSVTASLSVPGEPYGLLYSPASDRLYCPDDGRGSVTIVSGDGTRILKTLPLGDDPYVLLRVPRHDRIYVGDLGRAWVYVIKDSPGGIEEDPENRPLAPALRISPSPFTRMVTAMLANGGAESAPVRVFSLEGRLVGTFGAWQAEAGRARAVWDGLGLDGKPVPRGVYIASAADSGCRVKLVRSE
jgi:YVTN family beta-propeller protein